MFSMAGIGVHDGRNPCSASVGIGVHVRPERAFRMGRNTHDKLIEVCCRGGWSGTSVGRWLNRHKDRVINGRSFVCRSGGGRNVMSWQLKEQATKGQSRLPGA
jgi:hypothetical protein